MNKRYEEIIEKSDRTIEDRTKIADVLIKAQEKAELIIADAVRKANKEKKEIESLIELEREKLVDIKKEIKVLQTDVIDRLKKYEVSLDEIIEEDKAVG